VPDQVGIRLRLRPPQPGAAAGLVHRPRLQQQLTRGTTRPVTLVSAGPGSGKTSTIADWAASRAGGADPPAVAWLTVDGTDNDLPTFWADVLAALTVSGALPTGSPLRDLARAMRSNEVAAPMSPRTNGFPGRRCGTGVRCLRDSRRECPGRPPRRLWLPCP